MRQKSVGLGLALLVYMISIAAYSQQKRIVGKVISAQDKSPIAGATVTIKDFNGGKVSDDNGAFILSVPQGAGSIHVSAVGYLDTTVTIHLNGENTVQLTPSVSSMMDVVVTAAGGLKTQVRAQGYNATVVNNQSLTQAKPVQVASGLQAKVPGLLISNTSGGVNPNYRIVLRGQRSLTGNNQALIVLDNVVVPNDYLANLNPNDIESINVLNGSSAAALYGSQASNGALIITTKKGKSGVTMINVTNSTTVESVAFFPKLQNKFGAGGSGYGTDEFGNPYFVSYENGSYGPAFDGSTVPLGDTLEDGTIQMVPYAANNSRKKFWDKGITNQTGFSVSSSDEKSTFLLSGQYVRATGTTPGDKSTRASLRLNGTRKIFDDLKATYSVAYTQNRSNTTTKTSDMYANMLEVPANVPILNYANWRTDKYASPDGYYNPWYLNPYFSKDNYREDYRKDFLAGNVQLDYNPLDWLGFTYRLGITTANSSYKSWNGAYNYSDYAKDISGGSKSDIAASVEDANAYWTNLTSDFQIHLDKKINDFGFNLTVGEQIIQNESKGTVVGASGLIVEDLYNVGNSVGTPTANEANYKTRLLGLYGDLKISYKNYAYLEATGRNDYVSVLNPDNRSVFYPGVSAAFIPTSFFGFMQKSSWLDYLKIRGAWSKTGLVNIGTNSGDYPNFGAYSLYPTFSQSHGFPYGNLSGFTVGDTLVSSNLKPEFTSSWEVGFDMNVFKNLATLKATYFSSKTTNQTLTTGISNTTGYSRYLLNGGETYSKGVELGLVLSPIHNRDWDFNIGINYSYYDNGVNSISPGLSKLAIASYGGTTGSYAVPGYAYPVLLGYDYDRDPKGRIIVDGKTGLPTKSDTLSILGNAAPKHILGISPSVKYKNFSLSAVVEYRGGYKVYNNGGGELAWSGSGYATAIYNRQRFVIPNSVYYDDASKSYVPNTNISTNTGNESFWADNNNYWSVDANYITSGDFWKVRELILSYTFSQAFLSKIGFIKSATLSLEGRNLFVWLPKSNYYTDPEYSDAGNGSNGVGLTGLGQTPPSRYYGGTISINF